MNRSPMGMQAEDSSEMEGARSATGVSEAEASPTGLAPRPFLTRRFRPKLSDASFTTEYKLRIVREAERCKGPRAGSPVSRAGVRRSGDLTKGRGTRSVCPSSTMMTPGSRIPYLGSRTIEMDPNFSPVHSYLYLLRRGASRTGTPARSAHRENWQDRFGGDVISAHETAMNFPASGSGP